MRRTPVATALVLTAGLTASAILRRLVRRRLAGAAAPAVATLTRPAPVRRVPVAAPAREAVVLPFARRAEAAPVRSSAPVRCGDTGGRTKAGTPCAARARADGRCHHHPVAA